MSSRDLIWRVKCLYSGTNKTLSIIVTQEQNYMFREVGGRIWKTLDLLKNLCFPQHIKLCGNYEIAFHTSELKKIKTLNYNMELKIIHNTRHDIGPLTIVL